MCELYSETYLPLGTSGKLSAKIGRLLNVRFFGDVDRLVPKKTGRKNG